MISGRGTILLAVFVELVRTISHSSEEQAHSAPLYERLQKPSPVQLGFKILSPAHTLHTPPCTTREHAAALQRAASTSGRV